MQGAAVHLRNPDGGDDGTGVRGRRVAVRVAGPDQGHDDRADGVGGATVVLVEAVAVGVGVGVTGTLHAEVLAIEVGEDVVEPRVDEAGVDLRRLFGDTVGGVEPRLVAAKLEGQQRTRRLSHDIRPGLVDPTATADRHPAVVHVLQPPLDGEVDLGIFVYHRQDVDAGGGGADPASAVGHGQLGVVGVGAGVGTAHPDVVGVGHRPGGGGAVATVEDVGTRGCSGVPHHPTPEVDRVTRPGVRRVGSRGPDTVRHGEHRGLGPGGGGAEERQQGEE